MMDPDIECLMDSPQDRGGYLQSCGESRVWSAPDAAAAKGGKRGGAVLVGWWRLARCAVGTLEAWVPGHWVQL